MTDENLELNEDVPAVDEALEGEPASEQEGGGEAEAQEYELVSDDDSESEQGDKDKSFYIQRRLKAKKERQPSETEIELNRLQQENAVLKSSKPVARPKRASFDDPDDYADALDGYYEAKDQPATTSTVKAQPNIDVSGRIDTELKAHYERAEELKFPDYTEMEAKVIEQLGGDEETVKGIIMAAGKDSAKLMFYFGKNPAKLQKFISHAEAGGNAHVELGRICSTLKLKPKARSSAPAPEPEVSGGVGGNLEAKLRKDMSKAADSGDIKAYRELKKQAKKQGLDITI